MSLQVRLDRIRASFEKQASAEVLEIFHRVTEDLRASGMMDSVVGEGQRAPDFTLDDSQGNATSLSQLLASGPVVLTFYRGDW